jgi:hypothetical protein
VRLRKQVAVAAAAMCAAGGASALEFNTGNPDLAVRWDNTVRYNLSGRAERRDPAIANYSTTDESDNKFGGGKIVNNRLDIFSELDMVYQSRLGARLSAAGWYDAGYNDHSVPTGPNLAVAAATTTTPTRTRSTAITTAPRASFSMRSSSATSTSPESRCV